MADAGLNFLKLKLDFMEFKFGIKRGGHRFWLFVLNWIVSLLLVLLLALWVHWVYFVLVAIGFAGVVAFVDVVKIWNRLVG